MVTKKLRRADRSVNPKETPAEGWSAWARAAADRLCDAARRTPLTEEEIARIADGTWRPVVMDDEGRRWIVADDNAPPPRRRRVPIDAGLLPEWERAGVAYYVARAEGLSLDDARASYLATIDRELLPRVVRSWYPRTRGPWWHGQAPGVHDLAIIALLAGWDPGKAAARRGWEAVTSAVRGELGRARAEPTRVLDRRLPRARDAHAPADGTSGASSGACTTSRGRERRR